jgi:hypothetical protein
MESVLDVDLNSIPGHCVLKEFGTTNRDVFNVDKDGCYDLQRLLLIRNIVYRRFTSLEISDPIYVFVKPEPHKKTKLEEGRLRLISGVSLVDSLVDRILFKKLVDGIMSRLTKTPITVGWSPLRVNIFNMMMEKNSTRQMKDSVYLCVDKSSWDWTVHPWLIDMVKTVLTSLVADAPAWFIQKVNKRFNYLFCNPEWKFQDGTIITQKQPGIMKSGCYLTIWINSISQLLIHHISLIMNSIPPCPFLCLGDDTIQVMESDFDKERYLATLRSLGFSLKVHELKDPEFAGFIFRGLHFYPAYEAKHQFLLRHLTTDTEVAAQTLASYQLLYANDTDRLVKIRKLARDLDLPIAIVPDQRLHEIIWR